MADPEKPAKNYWPRPGSIGTFASLVSIPLSIYLYIASQAAPGLTYFVNPAKAAVVRTGQASGLTVQYDGHVLTTDVSAAKVAVWNEGRQAIRTSSVLKPLVIRTANGARILEAHIQKTSRDVIGITLDQSHFASGELTLNWGILEHNDAAIVQLVYLGNEDVDITASAVMEGQPEIHRLEMPVSDVSAADEYKRQQAPLRRFGQYVVLVFGILITAAGVYGIYAAIVTRNKVPMKFVDWVGLVFGIVVTGQAIRALQTLTLPPISF